MHGSEGSLSYRRDLSPVALSCFFTALTASGNENRQKGSSDFQFNVRRLLVAFNGLPGCSNSLDVYEVMPVTIRHHSSFLKF